MLLSLLLQEGIPNNAWEKETESYLQKKTVQQKPSSIYKTRKISVEKKMGFITDMHSKLDRGAFFKKTA